MSAKSTQSSTVPLNECGRIGSFKRALAEKLATSGLTEAEYVEIARKMGTADYRFKAYINHFIEKGYSIEEIENGRYMERQEPSRPGGSLTSTLAPSNGEIPTKEEIEKILREIDPKRNGIDEDILKSTIENSYASEKRKLKSDWWEITKRNLAEWSKKG